MCAFCEEPFRTILLGVAAVGLIVIVRAAWKWMTARAPVRVEAGS